MMFLAILDQLNEFDGEFDEEDFDDQIDVNELGNESNVHIIEMPVTVGGDGRVSVKVEV